MTPRQMGRKGGKATGASKVRGDSAYYRALAAKRVTVNVEGATGDEKRFEAIAKALSEKTGIEWKYDKAHGKHEPGDGSLE